MTLIPCEPQTPVGVSWALSVRDRGLGCPAPCQPQKGVLTGPHHPKMSESGVICKLSTPWTRMLGSPRAP